MVKCLSFSQKCVKSKRLQPQVATLRFHPDGFFATVRWAPACGARLAECGEARLQRGRGGGGGLWWLGWICYHRSKVHMIIRGVCGHQRLGDMNPHLFDVSQRVPSSHPCKYTPLHPCKNTILLEHSNRQYLVRTFGLLAEKQ